MSLTINLDEKPLFPHILVRNMAVELNFGENENPWNETLEGFTLLQNADEEQTVQLSTKPIPEDTQPEVIIFCNTCGFIKICFPNTNFLMLGDCGLQRPESVSLQFYVEKLCYLLSFELLLFTSLIYL